MMMFLQLQNTRKEIEIKGNEVGINWQAITYKQSDGP